MTQENVDNIRKQFTRQAQAYADTEQAKDERSMAGLVEWLGATAQDHSLDVACGPGVLTRAFAQVCKTATGCDVTEALLEIAREEAAGRGLSNITFCQGNASDLPFEDDHFDIVSCRAAYHHFATPIDVLKDMKRVMKPGGKIMIADLLTSEDKAQAEAHNEIEVLCDPSHTRALPLSEFKSLFDIAGLKIANSIESEMHYELEAWIAHGGPVREQAEKIREAMRSNIAKDGTGLKVREEGGKIHFTHQVAVFSLTD